MRRIITIGISITLLAILSGCGSSDGTSPEETSDTAPHLLFSSGFEEGVFLATPEDGYQYIQGTDTKTGFSWPIDILGASGSALADLRPAFAPRGRGIEPAEIKLFFSLLYSEQ